MMKALVKEALSNLKIEQRPTPDKKGASFHFINMLNDKEYVGLLEKDDLIEFLNLSGFPLPKDNPAFLLEMLNKISFFVSAYILQKLLKGLEFEELN